VVRAQAQPPVPSLPIPEVFLIGEYEDRYLDLSKDHPALFLSVFDNDVDKAYKVWSTCLADMEEYAAQLDFDLRGVKLWINMYFNPDGTIAHLAFFRKPNSRNVPDNQLSAFFRNFVDHYKLPAASGKGFQHSTSAAFPTFFQPTGQELVKRN
jgi:hypothetical protein